MRKTLATILAFIYLLSATGLNVQSHYCMNKLAGWDLFKDDSSVCSACGMEQNDQEGGCCKNESAFFKNTSDQQGAEAVVQVAPAGAAAWPVSLAEAPSVYQFTQTCNTSRFIPPDRSLSPRVYILNCIFRI